MRKRRHRTRVHCAPALVIFATLAAAPGFASDVTLTASTGAGIMYGVTNEFVFGDYNNKSYIKSQLDWDIRPLFYTKAALALSAGGGFFASFDVRMGIPAKTGLISDSDWLNYDYDGTTARTNYSESDCFTERAILLDAKVGWKFPVATWLSLEPFLAFGFMDFKWTARDGYFQYPPNWFSGPDLPYPPASTQPKVPLSGTGIIYQQTYFIPAAGIAAAFRAGKDFGISVSFAYSPLVFCNDFDNHELAGLDFYDYLWAGYLLEPKVSLKWQASERALLSLDVAYRHIAGLIGTTYVVKTGPNDTPGLVAGKSKNGAGASFYALDASLTFTWVL
jgi:outer membrane protease